MKILRVSFVNDAVEEIIAQISLNSLRGEVLVQTTKNRELEKFLRNLFFTLWTPDIIKYRGIMDESEILRKIESQLRSYSFNSFRIKNFLIQKL